MKKDLYGLVFLPLITLQLGSSFVKNYVKSEAGGNSKVESRATTNVNGQKTEVSTNQPGEVELKVYDGRVEIKTSEGVTPTVIIGQEESPASLSTGGFKGEKEAQENSEPEKIGVRISFFLKDLLKNIFNFFHR